MLRIFDVVLSAVGMILLLPVLLVLTIVGLLDTGAPLFLQRRVGRHGAPFVLVKFRTMKKDMPHVASHLADPSGITGFGRLLRRTKLDELPQLWNVLVGDMSLVGPRPCLFNQEELIAERRRRGVDLARPGITGLAQVSGIDMSTPILLAETDQEMLRHLDARLYFGLIFRTATGRGAGDAVRHGADSGGQE